jgi:hypothetical protein
MLVLICNSWRLSIILTGRVFLAGTADYLKPPLLLISYVQLVIKSQFLICHFSQKRNVSLIFLQVRIKTVQYRFRQFLVHVGITLQITLPCANFLVPSQCVFKSNAHSINCSSIIVKTLNH